MSIPEFQFDDNGNYAYSVNIFKDGDQICVLLGKDLQEGTAGFGKTLIEALRDLADHLEAQEYRKKVNTHPENKNIQD